jgi:hypothetical protein
MVVVVSRAFVGPLWSLAVTRGWRKGVLLRWLEVFGDIALVNRRALAIALVGVGFAGFVVNYPGGIEARCSEEGWSGCGWTWQLSGWVVLVCLAGLLGVGLSALVRRRRRRR